MSKRVKVMGDRFHPVVPDGAVYVGRESPYLKRSPFANPYSVRKFGREIAIEMYINYLAATGLENRVREELEGKDLACWCPLVLDCHADILLEILNGALD